jgi:hypothetical protein
MKSSSISHQLLAILALAIATTVAIAAFAQPGKNDEGKDTTASTPNAVTHIVPPGHYVTREEMRAAKPMPMPSVNGPPVSPPTTPAPYTGPVGSSPPGLGGPAPR